MYNSITPRDYSKLSDSGKRKLLESIDILEEEALMYRTLKHSVKRLFKAMDRNTTYLWRDDLECTHECIVLENVDDGVKVGENDTLYMPTDGENITNLMIKITKRHLQK